MVKFILIMGLSLLAPFESSYKSIDLDHIRSNYDRSVTEKKICEMMINELNEIKTNNVQLAYLGAFQAIWANHVNNPLAKLITFNRGKKNIDKAIKNEKNNIEIHFIRLSIQKNCPKFLGYSQNLIEDELYLRNNIEKVQSVNLKNMINQILKN